MTIEYKPEAVFISALRKLRKKVSKYQIIETILYNYNFIFFLFQQIVSIMDIIFKIIHSTIPPSELDVLDLFTEIQESTSCLPDYLEKIVEDLEMTWNLKMKNYSKGICNQNILQRGHHIDDAAEACMKMLQSIVMFNRLNIQYGILDFKSNYLYPK